MYTVYRPPFSPPSLLQLFDELYFKALLINLQSDQHSKIKSITTLFFEDSYSSSSIQYLLNLLDLTSILLSSTCLMSNWLDQIAFHNYKLPVRSWSYINKAYILSDRHGETTRHGTMLQVPSQSRAKTHGHSRDEMRWWSSWAWNGYKNEAYLCSAPSFAAACRDHSLRQLWVQDDFRWAW